MDDQWCWNLDQLSIDFTLRLHLRTDLPYADQHCVGNLGLSARWILTSVVATHANILTRHHSTTPYGMTSTQVTTLPYRSVT